MTSYSTAVWLRCRGASQETDRLLSSLCVRIKWDTVTGAAGEKTKNIRMKYKQHKVMPLSIRGSIFPSMSYCVTRNDSHCHCHSLNFLFCGESKMGSPAVICCFLRIPCYPSNIYPNRRRAYLLSLKQNQSSKKLHLTQHCTAQFENKTLRFSALTATMTQLSHVIYEYNSISYGTVKFHTQNLSDD